MRLQVTQAPWLVALAVVWWIGGLVWLLVTVFLLLVARLVASVSVMRSAALGKPKTDFTLISLPLSHYVERVRWCLEKSEVSWDESPTIGFSFIWSATTLPVLQVNSGVGSQIRNSVDALRYLYGRTGASFLRPNKVSEELNPKLNEMGRWVQTWVYYNLFHPEGCYGGKGDAEAKQAWGLNNTTIPLWLRLDGKLLFPLRRRLALALLAPARAVYEKRRARLVALWDQLALRLQDQPYLCGDELTAIDITVASLGALMVDPPEYGGRWETVNGSRVDFSGAPPRMQQEFAFWREHPLGQWILRVYREHRAPRSEPCAKDW